MDDFKRRLLIVASKLDVVHATMPANRFGFAYWVGSNWAGKEDLSCGTSACAIGWGTTDPELRALGLRLFKNGPHGLSSIGIEYPDGSTSQNIEDVASLFGLDMNEFDYLFVPSDQQDSTVVDANKDEYGWHTPDENASAKDVADHIRHFVKYKYGD